MDIKKILERAADARTNDRKAHSATSADPLVKKDRPGWVSPAYTESHLIEIKPSVAYNNRCVCILPGVPEIDRYKVVRAQIQQRAKENGWNTIMVTSPNPGEGKTITAVNIALTFAKEYSQTVLLVDCDLKQQQIHQYLGFSSDTGLIDCILEDRPLRDVIIWPGIEKLTLISGGRTIQDSTELLGAPKMKLLVAEMKARYDDRFIIFDVPAVLNGADAMTFAPLVDGIVMVVKAGKTSTHDIQKALELIPKDKFLGFVLNRAEV